MASAPAHEDPLDDILNLEEQFYAEGFEQGTRDGIQAGKVEGRSVGLAQGFDKFLESGRLYGKAVVWANRMQAPTSPQVLPSSSSASASPAGCESKRSEQRFTPRAGDSASAEVSGQGEQRTCLLPPLPRGNARLDKNVIAVHALVEPETLSTDNTDEAVNDFDDRVKRAQGRAKVVERMIGEQGKPAAEAKASTSAA